MDVGFEAVPRVLNADVLKCPWLNLILAGIDMDQRLPPPDELIVGHVQRHHDAEDLRRDRDRAAIGIGVSRSFMCTGAVGSALLRLHDGAIAQS
jgi:hypothetical protein